MSVRNKKPYKTEQRIALLFIHNVIIGIYYYNATLC